MLKHINIRGCSYSVYYLDLQPRNQKHKRNLNKNKKTYNENLKCLNIETLKERRNILSRMLAEKCVKQNKITKDMFKIKKTKVHKMKLSNLYKYRLQKVNTMRMQKSAIYQMAKYLNKKK